MLFFNLPTMTMKHVTITLLFMVLTIGLPCLAGDAVTIDGELHIRNAATPSQGIETLRLTELWRAGGENDDEMIFGQIGRVDSDTDGNVYLFDAQLSQVYVFSPHGELVRTLFGEGEGPGELRLPRDMALLPDGNIGVVLGFGGKLVILDSGGNPLPGVDITTRTGRGNVNSIRCRGGQLVIGGTEYEQLPRDGASNHINYLSSYDLNGKEKVRYLEFLREVDYHNNFTFEEKTALIDFIFTFDIAPDGRIYTFPDRDEYAISVYHPTGQLDRVIEREFTSLKRTPEDTARMETLIERRFRTFPFDLTIEIAETEPDINWLHRGIQVDDDGLLWIRHSRSNRNQPRGIMLSYDVFDRDGHFIKQVAIPCEGNGLVDGIFFVGNNRLLQVRGYVDSMRSIFGGGRGGFEGEGEPQPLEVICYRIER
jgi:6-bladed beta-propeller